MKEPIVLKRTAQPITEAEELAIILKRQGVKKSFFAEECGVRNSTLTRWLSGKVRIPKLVMKFARLYFGEAY